MQHGRGAGRATDDGALHARELLTSCLQMAQQALPYGGYAGRERHLLGFEQFKQRFPVQRRSRKDQLGADHARDVRKSPSIDMEHRHDGHDGVACRAAQRIGQRGRIGVQQRRSMAVQHPFRVARGAGGVAQRAGCFLVERRPGVVRRTLRDQVFVAQQLVDARVLRHVGPIGHGDEGLDRLVTAGNGLDKRQEAQVEEDVPVFGMVRDIGDLIFMQARIDGV
ncbi:hypothetical protein D3C86_1410980 [compost metagenome]